MTTGSPNWTLHQGDAIDILPSLPGPYAVITDPPYGIDLMGGGATVRRGRCPAFRKRENYQITGDIDASVGETILSLCAARGWPICTFASPEHPWPGDWRQHLVWDKGGLSGIGGDRRTCWKSSWELIQVGRFPEVFGSRDEAILRFPLSPGNYADHPAAKPLSLMRYLIRKLVPPGGVVLDPFMGSGRTLVACLQLGIKAIGIEVDEGHFETARRALDHATGQDSLFSLTHPQLFDCAAD